MENSYADDNLPQEQRGHEQQISSTIEPTTDDQPNIAIVQNVDVKQDSESTQDDEPPAKKRRTGDTSTPQPKSRATSPPWKKAAAEGPTTFLVDGMRKSARTNALPLELQPQGDKRATRASINHSTPNIKSKYASTRHEPRPTTPASAQKTPANLKGRHVRTASNSTQIKPSSVTNSASTKTPQKSVNKRRSNRPPQSPSPVPSKSKSSRSVQTKTPVRTSGKVRQEVVQEDTSEEDDGGVDNNDEESGEDGEDEDQQLNAMDITPSVLNSSQRPLKLRLKFQPVLPKPQHPLHLDPPRMYGSFREWLEKEGPYEEGQAAPFLTIQDINREALIRHKVEIAQKPGRFLYGKHPFSIEDVQPDTQVEPKRQYTRHDALTAHAIRFRILQEREQRKHMGNAKKYAYEAQAKWAASQPKSLAEILEEHDIYHVAVATATAKQCVQDLKAKWDLLRQEVYEWRLERWKEEQDALGKENLKRVIQESEALLDSRIMDSADVSEEDGSVDEDTESEEDVDTDDNMSSDEGSDEEEDRLDDGDDDLTTEQLRKKYEKQTQNVNRPTEAAPVNADIEVPDEDDAKDYGDPVLIKGLDFDSEEVKAKIAEAQQDASQASLSDDESTNMDSESDMASDEDDSDEETASGESDGSREEDIGLAGFFGKAVRTEVIPIPAAQNIIETNSPAIEVTEVAKDVEMLDSHAIADAAQVQTPVSNSDQPTHLLVDNDKALPDENSALQIDSTAVGMERILPNDEDDTIKPDSHISMPATPVSVDMEKKHIPNLEVPHLLRATLREYQRDGFSWLADRYEHGANSILADEMGLGKTIQTITLLAYLALKHEQWGPHLVVVPTSVILNWEMEFKKFLPSFKVLSYYGSPEQRKEKRRGWLDDNKWNVVITSYHLVVNDQASFKLRAWHYLILDEAHNIKNFRSQRWQTLLTFRSHSRLLLTGTPLQNNLEELWSLLFFLIGKDKAEDFLGRQEFSLLFKKPADQILEDDQQNLDAEAQEQVHKLHQILRPRLLRRLKADVEKQMPGKYEHVVYCRLSKRQRYLYDGFLSRSQTRETLARGNYLSIINCLMQLRKVCNHPDLFETRPIVTSFAMPKSVAADYQSLDLFVRRHSLEDRSSMVNLDVVDLLPGSNGPVSALDTIPKCRLNALFRLRELVYYQSTHGNIRKDTVLDGTTAASTLKVLDNGLKSAVLGDLQHRAYITSLSSQRRPLYSHSLAKRLIIPLKSFPVPCQPKNRAARLDWCASHSSVLSSLVKSLKHRSDLMQDYLVKFTCTTPAVVAPDLFELAFGRTTMHQLREVKTRYSRDAFQEAIIRQAIAFPDKRLLQFDCGKLQKLASLLRTLQAGGHRALIFTQMTKVLDILEQFLNIHGHRYLRLDGSTKLENRQLLTERFNSDTSILAFILSSRSGGLGINLTGADTVIFYDLDWNPAMDKQCQDRAHRIGQTRDVHIYRFVSEHTIEANILRKSNQKRLLDDVIIQEGDFTTDYFNKPSNRSEGVQDRDLEDADAEASAAFDRVLGIGNASDATTAKMLGQAEDKEDVAAARVAEREFEGADARDFDEKDSTSNRPTRPSSRAGREIKSNDETCTSKDEPRSDLWITGEVTPRTDMAVDIFKEKQSIGIDRHIIEFLEWEGKDVLFVPVDIAKKKKKKRSDDHRVRKRER